ncbi:MAG: ABC transporter permease [Desulfococcaceae bacterium]
MGLRRIWILFRSRNAEFFRDRAAFGWNFLFPFFIVAGFALIFGGEERSEYKIGVFPAASGVVEPGEAALPPGLPDARFVEFIGFPDREAGLERLRLHKIHLLLQLDTDPPVYWATDGPGGYVAEAILSAATAPASHRPPGDRRVIEDRPIRYIDWLFPGILAMNMMFSALWGVGFIIVRYRKNGVLKRFKATPLRPFEYLTAQMISRIFVLMFILLVMWYGCDLIFDFEVRGSVLVIMLLYFLGGLSLTALGMIVASRGSSEEFASGVINFIGWPMMFLSEVWFSLEGAPEWLRKVAEILPLTHLLRGVRRVMNEGAGLAEVTPEIAILAGMTVAALAIGSLLFSWNE